MTKVPPPTLAIRTATPQPQYEFPHGNSPGSRATRETIESIAVAVILAFLFRAFVAEAFVIPTGSMAPTLQGRHMDVVCEKCSYPYRTGASVENDGHAEVVKTTCPICRYPMTLRKAQDPNQRSFNGDRILVSKFCYEFAEPHRWDVIVFKYPGNAKQNYIKRLIGLPNETLWIRHGDILTRPNTGEDASDGEFHIARKPPRKVKAMSQLVDDTNFRAKDLIAVGWPERWQDWSRPEVPSWKMVVGGHGFRTEADGDGEAWLRYKHLVPHLEDWEDVRNGKRPVRLETGSLEGELISDDYAYNDGYLKGGVMLDSPKNWVGDLAVLANVELEGDSGELLLDLVEGGVHYGCRIDVATGRATLSIDGGRGEFVDDQGRSTKHPTGSTRLRGPGKYSVRFSNFDDQLLLWVGESLVEFDSPTTYHSADNVKPRWSPEDPGDLLPVGIGAKHLAVRATRLRVYRDVYYIANTYRDSPSSGDYVDSWTAAKSRDVLADPSSWATTALFDRRRQDVTFLLEDDQFFPLGDNSPQSRDARLWSANDGVHPPPPPFVERRLLTGKALMIYWPHAWRRPVPFVPNVKRMGLIR